MMNLSVISRYILMLALGSVQSFFFSLVASIPVRILKSEFSKEILLLSFGSNDISFLGLDPKTIRLVLIDLVGANPLKMARITSVRAPPIMSQHSL